MCGRIFHEVLRVPSKRQQIRHPEDELGEGRCYIGILFPATENRTEKNKYNEMETWIEYGIRGKISVRKSQPCSTAVAANPHFDGNMLAGSKVAEFLKALLLCSGFVSWPCICMTADLPSLLSQR